MGAEQRLDTALPIFPGSLSCNYKIRYRVVLQKPVNGKVIGTKREAGES